MATGISAINDPKLQHQVYMIRANPNFPMQRPLLALLLLLALPYSMAETVYPMDQTEWVAEGDRFKCSLELELQAKGRLAFAQGAGEPLRLVFRPERTIDLVTLASVTAPWHPPVKSAPLTFTSGTAGHSLNANDSAAVMQALDDGLWLAMGMDRQETRIPAVKWQAPAAQFRHCVSGLAPLSVAQARDQVLFYGLGQRALSAKQHEQLEKLARYVLLDPKVSRILVDSYTDNTGSRFSNLQISRERAADVSAALQSLGIPESSIETRAHGERFPSADNSTARGRELSRRVSLRVIRQ